LTIELLKNSRARPEFEISRLSERTADELTEAETELNRLEDTPEKEFLEPVRPVSAAEFEPLKLMLENELTLMDKSN